MINSEVLENSIKNMLDYLENAPKQASIDDLIERGVLSSKSKGKFIVNTCLSDIPKSMNVYINSPEILRSGKMCISFVMYDNNKVQKMKNELQRLR